MVKAFGSACVVSPIISLFQYTCLPQPHTCLFSPVVKWESGGNVPQEFPANTAAGLSGDQCWIFFTGWHLSMCKRLGRGRKIESYLITPPPLWPMKRARFVWTSDRNKLDSGKCSDNWSALWLLMHWLWSYGRKNFLHKMRGQESSNVSAIMLEMAFRGWWLMKTVVLVNKIAFFVPEKGKLKVHAILESNGEVLGCKNSCKYPK